MQPLNAREWLESQRLAGCEWAPELLEMLEDGERVTLLEGLCDAMRDLVEWKNPVTEREFNSLESAVVERVHLLEAFEEVLGEFAEGFEFDSRTIDPDDKLRAMFESPRWQKYDL